MDVVGEWVWGLVSALAGLLGVSLISIYFLLARVPTPDDLLVVGEAIIDKKIAEFGFKPGEKGQGRPPEGIWGFIESFVQTPMGQELIQKFTGNQQSGVGYIGP